MTRLGRPLSRGATAWAAFDDPSEEQVVRRHVAGMEFRELRPKYIEVRLDTLARLRVGIGGHLLQAQPVEIDRWFQTRALSAASRRVEVSHVRSFYRWATFEELIERDPSARLVRPKVQRRLPRPMPDHDAHTALTNAPPRVRQVLYLAAFAGFRACEVAQLRREDIFDKGDPPILIIQDGKGGKQRVVPLHGELAAVLAEDYMPRQGWLFPRTDGLPGHLSSNSICMLAGRYLRSLGIDHSLHTLRHFFGTKVYRASLDLRVTQELMGHSSPQTTAGYAAFAPERAALAVNALALPPAPALTVGRPFEASPYKALEAAQV